MRGGVRGPARVLLRVNRKARCAEGLPRGKDGRFRDHFFFGKKETVPAPKEKACPGAVQSAPVPGAMKYCHHWDALPMSGFRGRPVPLRGALPRCQTQAPRRGLSLSRKHCLAPLEAGSRAAHFFTSFPGAGRRKNLPQTFGRAFFFGSPKPFLFGSIQKEMGSESSRPKPTLSQKNIPNDC